MAVLNFETKDSFLWCTLNRADVRNAFNPEMIAALTDIPSQLTPEIRGVVLRGAGSVFSAGGDLNWMRKSLDLDKAQNLEDTTKLANMLFTLDRLPVPLVGMIHGAAMGGGVGLVAVCDYAIAEQGTQFSFSEARLGIIPACIAPFVIRKIGAGHARALFTTAERFGAPKAYEIGLVHQVVVGQEEMEPAVTKKLAEISECGPAAVRQAKGVIFDLLYKQSDREQLDLVTELLATVRVSPEGQEGLRAFLEKRKAKWVK